MAACQRSRNENKNTTTQEFTRILQQACYKTKLRFDLFQGKKSDESRKYKGLVCNGYINGVYVGQGYDELKGKRAQNDCAEKIINSILIGKVVVDRRVVEQLLKLLPQDYQKCAKPLPPAPRPHLPIGGKMQQSSSGSSVEGKIVQKKITNVWQKMLSQMNQNIATGSSNQQNAKTAECPRESIATKQILHQDATTERKSIQETQQNTATGGQSIQKNTTAGWQSIRKNTTTGGRIQQNTATGRQSIQKNTTVGGRIQQNTTTGGQSIQKNTTVGGRIQQNTTAGGRIQQNTATGGQSIQQNATTGGRIQTNAATRGTVQGNFPKIPESNLGYQMLRQMGWTGGGLGKEGNEGIEEPIVVNKVCGRLGLGMDDTSHQQRTLQRKQKKKQKTQPIINRKFINKFVRGDRQKIVVTEPLIDDDYRLLQKLCDKNCLLYEFVGPSKRLVIRKPLNWATTSAGQRIAKTIKTKMQRRMNKMRSSRMPTNPTNTDKSLTNSKDVAMMSIAKDKSKNETVSTTNVDTEHVAQILPTASQTVQISSDIFAELSYPLQSITTPDSTGHPSTRHGATSNRHGTTSNRHGTTSNRHGTSTGNGISDGHGTSSTGSAGPTTQTSIKTELLQLSTLDDFKLGDDVWEIFLAFLSSSDKQLNFSRNLTSRERLFLYMISDKYGFHFTLFSHGDEKNIVIRKC